MAERFTLLPDGTSVPYRPEVHDVPKSGPNAPKPTYARGDRVLLTGTVQEVQHMGGPHFKVRIDLPNNTIFLSEEHLKAADQARKEAEPEPEEEGKALLKPPATRHMRGPRETK